MESYIGITGIVTDEDVETARLCAGLVPAPRVLMAGVLVSAKTRLGQATTNRRYPASAEARRLVVALASFATPVAHYNTRSRGLLLAAELDALLEQVPAARGVQLNVVRPDGDAVEVFQRAHPEADLILQVNGSSLTSRTPDAVRRYVDSYPTANHALLDMSGGRGTAIDPTWAAAVLRHWTSAARPALAGGLGPDCADILHAVVAGAPGVAFSTDAESGVRVPVADPLPGERHQDRLDRDRALAYVRAVVAATGG